MPARPSLPCALICPVRPHTPLRELFELWTQRQSAAKKDRFARFDNERSWRALGTAREIATEMSTTPAAVSLAWLLGKPQVSSAIFGARSIQQLETNVKATELSLSPEQMQRLDAASAPELGYPYGFMNSVQGRW